MMKRIYVAGALTPKGPGNHALEYLTNVRNMIQASVKLMQMGHAPFCPALDFQYILSSEVVFTEREVKSIGLSWLAVCDAILLLPGWETSVGSIAELEEAKNNNLDIYYDLSEVPDGRP